MFDIYRRSQSIICYFRIWSPQSSSPDSTTGLVILVIDTLVHIILFKGKIFYYFLSEYVQGFNYPVKIIEF